MTTSSEAAEIVVPADRARRLRLGTIAAIAIVAGLTLITTTQTWWTLHLATKSLPIAGTVAAPALAALSLCGLALAAALSIAGPVFRLILGLLQLLLGFTIVLTSIVSLVQPDLPSESAVQTATGVAGPASIAALIRSVALTPWGIIAVVLGVAAFLVGVWLLASFRFWPAPSRKYQAVQFAPADGPRDAVIDWDALSDGTDPTEDSASSAGTKPVN
jgi:Tryptophan-associated transmembrane protein (Trp_oprn_chp)